MQGEGGATDEELEPIFWQVLVDPGLWLHSGGPEHP